MVKLLLGNKDLFENLGFEVESAGGVSVIVSSLPLVPGSSRPAAEWIRDMLNELLECHVPQMALPLQSAAGAACKAAIKAHDQLSLSGMEKLLDELKNCRQGTLCPHGRPTMIEFSLRELERRFGRK